MPPTLSPDALDAVFDALSDRRRRLICRVLADEGSLSFDELVDRVVAREASDAGDDAPDREPVAVDLRHVQLPKLDDVGFVAYDPDAGTVAYRADGVVADLLGYDARFADDGD